MTVSSSVNKVIYSGNSATVLFPVSYYFLENSHLKVILRAADGTETVQALTTNYTVTGAGNPAGGSVTMLVAPPTGTTLTIVRNVPATQETDYLANDPFPAESHERALDKLTMLVQENEEVASRALVIPQSSPSNVSTTLPNPSPLGILAWNQNANAINYISPSDIGTAVAYATAYADTFNCDGVDQTFTLTANPVVINNLDVSINGSTQVPNVDYTLSGTTLTMTTPPPINSVLLAKYKQGLPNFNGDSQDIRYVPAGSGAVQTNVQAKLRETVSVKDFGAVGDGVTDDTVAIQAALNSGAYKVVVPPGVYVTGSLTIPSWIELVGQTYPIGIAAGEGPVTFKFNLTSGTAITCNDNPVIRNIAFKNTGGSYNDTTDTLSGTTAICIQTNNNVTIDECSFTFWYTCVNIGGSPYYCKTNRIWFNRCTYGYLSDTIAPYNFNISEPFSAKTEIFFSGTATYRPRNIKIIGGSIEGYSKIAQYFDDISIFGTYFETVATRDGAFAIDPLGQGCSIALYGCLVYLDHTARFVNLSGIDNCMLTSVGNVFDGVGRASGVVFYLPNSTGNVHLAGDKFGLGHPTTCVYASPAASIGNFNIQMPDIGSTNTLGAYTHIFSCGKQGMIMNALSAEPTAKLSGMLVLANGVSWDPLSRAAGRPYWTVWQGDRWFDVSGA